MFNWAVSIKGMFMKKAILCVHVGEIGWECLRVLPHVLWLKKKKYKDDVALIVLTRPDRFDLYGKNANILEPLKINGDFGEYQSDCFRLTGYSVERYLGLMNNLVKKYSSKYKIVEKIQPAIDRKKYAEKGQYPQHEMLYKFKPRPDNKILIDEYIDNKKQCIVLAPRYRKQAKFRNWLHWEEFYNMLVTSGLVDEYNFIICGKSPEYIPSKHNKIYDINNIKLTKDSSIVGLTIEIVKRSILTIGSQSFLPILSNLLGTPTLQWGNEKRAHTITYNVNNTETIFIDDPKFNIKPKIIFDKMRKRLKC